MLRIGYLLMLSCVLMLVTTSAVKACDKLAKIEHIAKSSCEKELNHKNKKSCFDNDHNGVNNCAGHCKHSLCHCPTSVNPTVFYTENDVSLNHFDLTVTNLLAYIQFIPKAVYLSIWQPPKIS